MILRNELVNYLNDYLAVPGFPDYPRAYNGLQVEGRNEVKRIATAVDASLVTIARAVAEGADFMIVHHGLFWGATAPVTGLYYSRLAQVIKNDLGLYSCHLPLDAHPEVGNNHVLARLLDLEPAGVFGDYGGVPIGIWCHTDIAMSELIGRIQRTIGGTPKVIPTGPDRVKRIGIVTGGAGDWVDKAAAFGLDTFLTGEGSHHTYFEAEERRINLIYAGHYATETVGVRALGDHIEKRFGIETFFIDHPTGL